MLFPFFKKKTFFTDAEKQRVVEAIRNAEHRTSGEIRVYVESRNTYMDPMDRAAEIFYNLKMDKTDERNAVLLYIALKDKQLALFGDEGIYKTTGAEYWNISVKSMLKKITAEDMIGGMVHCITGIGETLHDKFPFNKLNDKNELPDEIVFGK